MDLDPGVKMQWAVGPRAYREGGEKGLKHVKDQESPHGLTWLKSKGISGIRAEHSYSEEIIISLSLHHLQKIRISPTI